MSKTVDVSGPSRCYVFVDAIVRHSAVVVCPSCGFETVVLTRCIETVECGGCTIEMRVRPNRPTILEKTFRLCRELDMELDGVNMPAGAAAILNGIRRQIEKMDYVEDDT